MDQFFFSDWSFKLMFQVNDGIIIHPRYEYQTIANVGRRGALGLFQLFLSKYIDPLDSEIGPTIYAFLTVNQRFT